MKKLLFCLAAPFLFCGIAAAGEGVVNISYVKSPFNLQAIVMKNRGILEEELKPLGLRPAWHEINSGAQQARAMAAGSLDASPAINTTSAQLAAAEGNPIKLIAAVSRPEDIFAIVAAKNGPRGIGELKGKMVAGPKGTALHQILAAALKRDGLDMRDIEFIQMDIPNAFAALESGQADAALLAANALLKAVQAGHRVLATGKGLATPKLAVAVSEDFLKKRPDAARAIVAAHDRAAAWIAANHQEAIALGASEQGISPEEAEDLFQRSHFTQRFSQADLTSMDDDMRFMLEQGMMRNPIDNRELVLPQAME